MYIYIYKQIYIYIFIYIYIYRRSPAAAHGVVSVVSPVFMSTREAKLKSISVSHR